MAAYTRSRAPRSRLKVFLIKRRKWLIVGFLVGVTTGFILLYEPATNYLARRKGRHAIGQAEGFVKAGDLDQATLAVRVAAAADPANPNLFRVAAEVMEQSGNSQAVGYRQQLLGMFPGNRADRIALIKCALQFGDLAAARTALAGFPVNRQDLELQLLTASVDTASGDRAGAEAALGAAAKLDSSDEQLRFRLATAQLHSPDPAVRQVAQASLEKLAADSGSARWDARRELLRNAAAQKQLTDARRLEADVMANPAVTFADRLLQLTVEQALLRSAGTDDLTSAESAAKTPAQIGQLGNWLVVTHQSSLAQRWLDSLPGPTQAELAVLSARADVAADLHDWTKLTALLEMGAWGPISPETVRTALTAREMAERSQTDLTRGLWNEDLSISRGNLRGLMILDRLAGLWKLEPERRATLEAIVNVYPTQHWALADLLTAYYSDHDTASLARIWAAWEKTHPDDRTAQNDSLMITLLRESGRPTPAVKEKSDRLYQSAPTNPFFATTRALCYLRDHNAPAAVALFAQMPEADRAMPSRALIYGAALAATKQAALARTYLSKASATLPEERAIQQAAQAQLAKL